MASKNRYMIGRHSFLEMSTSPRFSSVKVTYALASNTDGASIFKDGNRGELFSIHTVVDAAGADDVRQVIQFYHNMTGRIHEVRYDGIVYGRYLVDHVHPVAKEVLKLVGGIRKADPTHVVECLWTLFPVRGQYDEVEADDA